MHCTHPPELEHGRVVRSRDPLGAHGVAALRENEPVIAEPRLGPIRVLLGNSNETSTQIWHFTLLSVDRFPHPNAHPDEEALALGVAVQRGGIDAHVHVIALAESLGRLDEEPVAFLSCVVSRAALRRGRWSDTIHMLYRTDA